MKPMHRWITPLTLLAALAASVAWLTMADTALVSDTLLPITLRLETTR